MIINYILDPEILNENNISQNHESIRHVKNEIFQNSVILFDKNELIKKKLISNLELYGKKADYDFVEETEEFLLFFQNPKIYFTSNIAIENQNDLNLNSFAKSIDKSFSFYDFSINESSTITDKKTINLKKFSKSDLIKNKKKSFDKLYENELKNLDKFFIEKMLGRCVWNSSNIYIYDQYITGSLKWDNKNSNWFWDNQKNFKERYDSIKYWIELIDRYSLLSNVNLKLVTWPEGASQSILPKIYSKKNETIENIEDEDEYETRKLKEIQTNKMKKKLYELLPENTKKVSLTLVVKELQHNEKKHRRVLKTASKSIDLDKGLDIISKKNKNEIVYKGINLSEFKGKNVLKEIDEANNLIKIKKIS